jgi:hypothetical protein
MRHIRHLLIAALVSTGTAACSDSSTSSSSSSGSSSAADAQPWTRPFIVGNFAVNTADVVTFEDGSSADIVSDYVNASGLPSANLEVFSINFYLPSSESAEPSVSAARVFVAREDASRTPDIYKGHERVQNATIDGKRYTVFRVTGMTVADPPITSSDFANVSFEIDYAYGSAKSGSKTAEIYKR